MSFVLGVFKIQIGFTLLVPAHPGNRGKKAVKRVCVCVCTVQYEAMGSDEDAVINRAKIIANTASAVRWTTFVVSFCLVRFSRNTLFSQNIL